jgi:hypothetical protein
LCISATHTRELSDVHSKVDASEVLRLGDQLYAAFESCPSTKRNEVMGRDPAAKFTAVSKDELLRQQFYKVPFLETLELVA